jgi:RNA polymerase sigma factor (sigma-70 family)
MDAAQLFRDNVRIVGFLLQRARHVGRDDWPDLEQQALIALWHAARRYHPDRGEFAPYAFQAVRHAVGRFLRHRRRAPRTLSLETERTPDGRRLADLVEARPGPDTDARLDAHAAAARLTPQRRRVALDPRPSDELGRALGVSGQRVRQQRAAALADLRRLLG